MIKPGDKSLNNQLAATQVENSKLESSSGQRWRCSLWRFWARPGGKQFRNKIVFFFICWYLYISRWKRSERWKNQERTKSCTYLLPAGLPVAIERCILISKSLSFSTMLLTRANWKKCRKCQDIPLCVVEICLVLTIIILLTQVLLVVINYTSWIAMKSQLSTKSPKLPELSM